MVDLAVTEKLCKNKGSISECDNFTILHTGKAVYKFLSCTDTIKTRIGEYTNSKKDGIKDLMVHGHQVYDLENPNWLLTKDMIPIDVSCKLKSSYDRPVASVLRNYCVYKGTEETEYTLLIEKLKSIDSYKLLLVPFKPFTKCRIYVGRDRLDATIDSLTWRTDKETGKIVETIGFRAEDAYYKEKVKFPITEYEKSFRLNTMEIDSNKDDKLIEITDDGIIKPIKIIDKDSVFAIDNTYVYYENSETNEKKIIGYWNDSNELVLNCKGRSKALSLIKNNEKHISRHLKYIAPYKTYDAKEVEI